jgi:hypothetical protein
MSFATEILEKQTKIRNENLKNTEIIDAAVEDIKEVLSKFAGCPTNCNIREFEFKIIKSPMYDTFQLVSNGDNNSILVQPGTFEVIEQRLKDLGFRVSGSFGDGGSLKLHW